MTALQFPTGDAPGPGEAKPIAAGVEWVRLPVPMAMKHVNAFVLTGDTGVTVVDTGIATDRTRALWTEALAGRRVSRVILTHHHPDHIGLAGWFAHVHGAQIAMSRTAYLLSRMLQLDVQERPTERTVAFWRALGMDAGTLAARLDERPFNFADATVPLPLGFTRLTDGQTLTAGGRAWRIRFGGGHAPDQAALWSEDGELLIGGDLFLPRISPNIGVHVTEPEADPLADWFDTLAASRASADRTRLVLPGHGAPFTGLTDRIDALRAEHQGALERLTAFLDRPRTVRDCFAPIYERHIPPGQIGLAMAEAAAHCLHLWHSGTARRWTEDGVWLFQNT